VTLIELLITITIIATLSAAFLGASRSAMETARAARTKTTIAKIHGLLMERWASYATRRVDIHPDIRNQINMELQLGNISATQRGQMLADARLLATRELMKLEMPDRWSDVVLDALPDSNVLPLPILDPNILANRPSLSSSYLRRLYQAANVKDDGVILRRNQGAECLYMIIMLATGDGEARTLFSQQDIGDTDEDGSPEFLDGWGNPIQFIRWPAGFVSDLQPLDSVTNLRNADTDHDPFDPFRRDTLGSLRPSNGVYHANMQAHLNSITSRHAFIPPVEAYRLVPLIYSQGPDDQSDVLLDTARVTGLDPYAAIYESDGSFLQLATTVDSSGDGDGWIDNIHNHLQDGR